ncbi:hypothetical protein [Streptomyces sp. GQFP]|uniref:hypothetical protein n=1 Tax=Streptomyces sp. GQFP TaxID=2907545 RepID=UPI001F24D8A3|nr:hypothetical protein [Streptomyces sp. GQFP]UIX31627.1 hypothetical protein LUX31_17145 [Streptomyces sp. GQFP]
MKRTSTAVTVIALALAFVGIGTSTASARSVMLYQHKNLSGGYYNWTAQYGNLSGKSWFFEPGSIDNAISSFDNPSSTEWFFFDGAGCTGAYYFAKAYSEDADLSSNSGNPSNFDNKISCVTI